MTNLGQIPANAAIDWPYPNHYFEEAYARRSAWIHPSPATVAVPVNGFHAPHGVVPFTVVGDESGFGNVRFDYQVRARNEIAIGGRLDAGMAIDWNGVAAGVYQTLGVTFLNSGDSAVAQFTAIRRLAAGAHTVEFRFYATNQPFNFTLDENSSNYLLFEQP